MKIYRNKNIIILALFFLLFNPLTSFSQKILIPMDLSQTDHLKSYGIAYWVLDKGQVVDWLLNYRGGSFLMDYSDLTAAECRIRGVFFEVIDGSSASMIMAEVQGNDVNMDLVRLEKPPVVGVYAQPGTQPWDDAVLLVLEYSEIPHEVFWDEAIMSGKLPKYDWLHLHHEDFTGQYGKFWANYAHTPWYNEYVTLNENMAKKLGYKKVSELKKSVAVKIREYIANGGFMFAMCSATDTYDIALASLNVDICGPMFDGDPVDPNANRKLDFSETLAFENFQLILDPYIYEHSNIDVTNTSLNNPDLDYFTLFEFSAKYDPVPTMLTQNHANIIHGFMGQTTGFHRNTIKNSVTIMGERENSDDVRYIHGNYGRGTFTFYGGHDPEDYRHFVGDQPTDLSLHKNSPGYRLILNNILFPAAKKKKQKT
mgnify:CR=1 FL=1